jgi:hypothetical protein
VHGKTPLLFNVSVEIEQQIVAAPDRQFEAELRQITVLLGLDG